MKRLMLICLLFISLFLFPSCREEVIAPDNITGSKNQPIVIQDNKSYKYILNSQNLTLRSRFELAYESNRIYVILTITDYTEGMVRINLQDVEGRSVHFETASGNKYATYEISNQSIVNEGELQLFEFTGKLKLELLRSN